MDPPLSCRFAPASNRRFAARLAVVIETGRRDMVRALVDPIAISEDRVLQVLLRRAAGVPAAKSCILKLEEVEAWVDLARRREHRLLRRPPAGGLEISLETLRHRDSRLERAIRSAAKISGAAARARAIADIVCGAHAPTRPQFAVVEPWIPVLEGIIYRVGLQLAVVIDDLRGDLLSRRRDPSYAADLRTYWDGVQTLSRLTLLACNTGARPWLTDMTPRFDWSRLSPSWLLVRERTVSLAQVAARAAAAFGPSAIEPYLGRLAGATSLVQSFDALLGLTAIGLSDEGQARMILVELTALRRRAGLGPGFDPGSLAAFGDAISVLRDPAAATLAFDAAWPERKPKTRRGPLERAHDHLDPLTSWTEGRWLGLAALPQVVSADLRALYPKGEAERAPPASQTVIERLFDRAWRGVDLVSVHADRRRA